MKKMLQAINGQCGHIQNHPAGSVFWFTVPCSSLNVQAAPALNDHAAPQMIRLVPTVLKPDWEPLVASSAALLVDDDRLAFFVMSRMLRRMNVDLQGEFDGAAGLSLLTSPTSLGFSWCVFVLQCC